MMRLEDIETRCFEQGCATIVNLDDYPEAYCDGCGTVTCDHCPHECEAA